MAKAPHLLIVEARFYDELSDALLHGAISALKEFGATHSLITVPGALEIPAAIGFAMEGVEAGKVQFDGFIALGVIIRGETYHFEIVANESARGLMDLSLEGLPIGNGILTTENEEQAWERASKDRLDKGGFAARAALEMIAIRNQYDSGKNDD